MPAPPKPLVVSRCCAAMRVALEVLAEHRRLRAAADLKEEAAAAEARAKLEKARTTKSER